MKLLGAAAIVGVLVGAGIASGAGSASRIVDRTLVCDIAGIGYPDPYRQITVTVVPRTSTSAPMAFIVYRDPDDSLFAEPTADTLSVGVATGPIPRHPTGFVEFSRTQCSASSRTVPLSSAGLRGGPVPTGKRGYPCITPAQVLIRIRGVFTRAVDLGSDSRFPGSLVAKGRLTKGQLAVRTLSGTPIAYASADDATGKVALFVARAPRCSTR